MRIVIVGGGISGLSTAWFCRHRYQNAHIVLLEKQMQLGGWIQTRYKQGLLFEEGPRTFAWHRSMYLRDLIEQLGLKEEILLSSSANKRYIWYQGKLRSLPQLLFRFSLPLLKSNFIKVSPEDQSIYDFSTKKFGKQVTETLLDPMTLGIYGGDIRKLSALACFPNWVKKQGLSFPKSGLLFTLKRGMKSLIDELEKQTRIDVVFGSEVEALEEKGVWANGRFWSADRIFSAVSGHEIGKLSGLWPDFPMKSLWCVFFSFPNAVLPKKGFGYLVPTKEKQKVLGMVWDSEIFPAQNVSSETRITVMVREEAQDPIQEALLALKNHLKIDQEPLYTHSVFATKAIPQFEVGYLERIQQMKQKLRDRFPHLTLVGNYLNGVSVDSCIQCAKESV